MFFFFARMMIMELVEGLTIFKVDGSEAAEIDTCPFLDSGAFVDTGHRTF